MHAPVMNGWDDDDKRSWLRWHDRRPDEQLSFLETLKQQRVPSLMANLPHNLVVTLTFVDGWIPL